MRTRACGGFAVCVWLAACGSTEGVATSDIKHVTPEIVNGTEATDLASACIVNLQTPQGTAMCSGALVAPNVVLTAGHCVAGVSRWSVKCPYARDAVWVTVAEAALSPTFPNRDDPTREYIDNSRGSDLGLLRTSRPLAEDRVARVRAQNIAAGLDVFAVGRIHHGVTNLMYRSPRFTLSLSDRTHGYWVGVDRTVIEPGDSGGPLFDVNTREVVGVNSAGVDPSGCTRGVACDEWAAIGPASAWFNATMQRFAGSVAPPPVTPPPPPTTDVCAPFASCATCTAQAACGWCDGRCATGTSRGPGAGSCTAWTWVSNQCPAAPPPPATDACATSTSCAACTARAACGWCNGRCATGTSRGATAGVCGASPWAWLSSQCR